MSHYHYPGGRKTFTPKKKKIKQKHSQQRPHPDEQWISDKMGNHGGSWGYDFYTGRATIYHIGVGNRYKVVWYNLLLFIKYLKRIVKGSIDGYLKKATG